MAVTAQMIAKFKDMTGATLVECKKVLDQTNGDIEAAAKLLGVEIKNSKNIRAIKYETFIEDIDKTIKKKKVGIFGSELFGNSSHVLSPLNLIFNFSELNEYGFIICKIASFKIKDENSQYADPWVEKYKEKSLEDARTKIDAAKDYVKFCRKTDNRSEAYKFIFWSLMILTVDKNNYDEKLSLICDFARMLNITDDEIMDIMYVIKFIYNEVEEEYALKTETIHSTFKNLFNLYGNNKASGNIDLNLNK